MKRDFYSENVVNGRRDHACQFCPAPILKGESHVYISMCSTGTYSSYRAHTACMMAASGRSAEARRLNAEACR